MSDEEYKGRHRMDEPVGETEGEDWGAPPFVDGQFYYGLPQWSPSVSSAPPRVVTTNTSDPSKRVGW